MNVVSRRGALRRLVAVAGALGAATLPWKLRVDASEGSPAIEGELVNGFLLLPDSESPLPQGVRHPHGYLPVGGVLRVLEKGAA